MIPNGLLDTQLETVSEIETTETYKMSPDKIQGYTEGLEALEQAIYKMLSTEKYEYPIYSFSYGVELGSLIGQDMAYVKIEFRRRVTECLLQDERITNVGNFAFVSKDDGLLCTFEVKSIYGSLILQKEVTF